MKKQFISCGVDNPIVDLDAVYYFEKSSENNHQQEIIFYTSRDTVRWVFATKVRRDEVYAKLLDENTIFYWDNE